MRHFEERGILEGSDFQSKRRAAMNDRSHCLPRAIFGLAALAVLSVGPPEAQAQAAEKADPDLTPGPWEITVEGSHLVTFPPAPALGNRGVGLRAGYRPAASRRGLVEVYGLYVPQGADAYDGPRVNAVGVMGTFMGRTAEKRLNPYLAGGVGLWQVDVQPLPPCRPEDGCFREVSRSFNRDVAAFAAVIGAGLYVTVLPSLALRGGADLHAPLALGGDRGSPRPVLSVGLSVRP